VGYVDGKSAETGNKASGDKEELVELCMATPLICVIICGHLSKRSVQGNEHIKNTFIDTL
jgi:hypothetical protein